MLIDLLILLIFAALLGKIESEIEGKNTWAGNLPTWKIKNKLTDLIFDRKPLTGYHFWLFLTIFLLFHIYFFRVSIWSLKYEAQLISAFLFYCVAEDFFAIILNPNFGFKKFRQINWQSWVGPIPKSYIIGILFCISFWVASLCF